MIPKLRTFGVVGFEVVVFGEVIENLSKLCYCAVLRMGGAYREAPLHVVAQNSVLCVASSGSVLTCTIHFICQ